MVRAIDYFDDEISGQEARNFVAGWSVIFTLDFEAKEKITFLNPLEPSVKMFQNLAPRPNPHMDSFEALRDSINQFNFKGNDSNFEVSDAYAVLEKQRNLNGGFAGGLLALSEIAEDLLSR